MIPVVTTDQMRTIDQKSIQCNTDIGYSLMKKAAMGVFNVISRMNLNAQDEEIAIICGKGNNGGDGYALGKILIDKGYKVMCYGLCEGETLHGEAHLAFEEYTAQGGNYFYIDDSADLKEGLERFSIIVDALLGTGAKGEPRGLYAEVISVICSSGKPVIAIDTPSGLDNNTGLISPFTVKADYTVTMGFPKTGQFFFPGRHYTGRLIIHSLDYPEEIVEQTRPCAWLPGIDDLRRLLPRRKAAGAKHDHGLTFLLCGSKGMCGSVSLAANAALRAGCGMVHCAVPESIFDTVSIKLTEPVLYPLIETEDGTSSELNSEWIIEKSRTMNSLCIGPGLSHNKSTAALVRKLITSVSIPVILDADGINAFKDNTNELKKHSSDLIITPHKKEYERLFGPVPQDPTALITELIELSSAYSMTIIYKGNPTIVSTTSSKAYIIPAGNSAMATAGSGDVLTGIVTSLVAQGCSNTDAAILGVGIHGLSGELASDELSEYSVIASDLISYLPDVFSMLSVHDNYSLFLTE